jgi:hypothetical protein
VALGWLGLREVAVAVGRAGAFGADELPKTGTSRLPRAIRLRVSRGTSEHDMLIARDVEMAWLARVVATRSRAGASLLTAPEDPIVGASARTSGARSTWNVRTRSLEVAGLRFLLASSCWIVDEPFADLKCEAILLPVGRQWLRADGSPGNPTRLQPPAPGSRSTPPHD